MSCVLTYDYSNRTYISLNSALIFSDLAIFVGLLNLNHAFSKLFVICIILFVQHVIWYCLHSLNGKKNHIEIHCYQERNLKVLTKL